MLSQSLCTQSSPCVRNYASVLFVLHILLFNGWRLPLLVACVDKMDVGSVAVPIEKTQSVFPFEKLDTHLKHMVMTFLDISIDFFLYVPSTASEHNSDDNEGAPRESGCVNGQRAMERGDRARLLPE